MKQRKILLIGLLTAGLLSACGAVEQKETDNNENMETTVVEPNAGTAAEEDISDEKSTETDIETKMETKTEGESIMGNTTESGQTNLLGGLSPEEALEYMKNTENLVIVEVNTAQWKKETPFTGAMWIPHDEMAERYDEIPEGCPVMLHCGAGVVSVPAYETLIEKRPDIPELSYIDGAPPIQEYNEWLEEQQNKE